MTKLNEIKQTSFPEYIIKNNLLLNDTVFKNLFTANRSRGPDYEKCLLRTPFEKTWVNKELSSELLAENSFDIRELHEDKTKINLLFYHSLLHLRG